MADAPESWLGENVDEIERKERLRYRKEIAT
jgi:hypothetical protein